MSALLETDFSYPERASFLSTASVGRARWVLHPITERIADLVVDADDDEQRLWAKGQVTSCARVNPDSDPIPSRVNLSR